MLKFNVLIKKKGFVFAKLIPYDVLEMDSNYRVKFKSIFDYLEKIRFKEKGEILEDIKIMTPYSELKKMYKLRLKRNTKHTVS
jgi:hypothetical protein